MSPRRILETAPDGSSELLDAVMETFITVDDKQFATIMRKRAKRPQPVSAKVQAFEDRLRSTLRPLGETQDRAAARIGPKRFYTLPVAHEQERVA